MDKLEAQAKSTRWIKHANMGDGHHNYWPDTCKVSVERNIIFPTRDQPKYVPLIPSNQNKPTYICQNLPETDPSSIPLLQSPTNSHLAFIMQEAGVATTPQDMTLPVP
jgi:hypothetical protein